MPIPAFSSKITLLQLTMLRAGKIQLVFPTQNEFASISPAFSKVADNRWEAR